MKGIIDVKRDFGNRINRLKRKLISRARYYRLDASNTRGMQYVEVPMCEYTTARSDAIINENLYLNLTLIRLRCSVRMCVSACVRACLYIYKYGKLISIESEIQNIKFEVILR